MFKLLRLATVVALSLSLAVGPAFSQAALLPNAKQTFLDQDGNPLSLGKVYSYVPNTVVPKTTWSDSGEANQNTNPVVLDAAGRAVIYGQGNYSQKVTDSADNIQWNALTTAYGSSVPSGATGTDTAPVGTVMPFAGLVVPTNWQFAYGQAVSRTTFAALMTAITIVDTTASCTSGSATMSNFASTAQMRVGAPIEASCISTGTTIVSITSATAIVVSNTASSSTTVTSTVFPWGNGDGALTFNVPDMRGRVPAGPDALGGTAASRLQVSTTITTTSGSAAATVASATGIAAGMTVVSANVPAGTTVSSIAGTAVTLSGNASASHGGDAATFQSFTSANAPGASGGSGTHTLITAELAAHSHGITDPGHTHTLNNAASVWTVGGATPQLGGAGTMTALAITANSNTTGVTVNSAGSSAPLSIVQPGITINYIVKMAANTTGAGGVVSIGGMFGDILCGANVTCASNTISFSGTPLLSTNQVYVGNASNVATSVALSGDCSIVASGAITCTKSSGSTIGTAAFQNIGTSGANVPLLNAANSWGATQTFAAITASTLNGNTFSNGSYTLTGVAGKTLTFNKSITLEGTDSTTMTFPSVSATIPRVVASGAKALATGAISSAACTSAQTDTATGALTSDAAEFNFASDPTGVTGYVPLTTGMLVIIPYITADTINFKVCNNTAASITPGAISINWRVVR